MLSPALILCLALTGQPAKPEAGYVAPGEVLAVHRALLAQLPEQARRAVGKRFPNASIVASCKGSFSKAGAAEVAITLLDGPVTGPAGEPPKILRLVLLADGRLIDLPWAAGPDWSYSGAATLDPDRGLFYGELKCLPGGQAKTFAKGFLSGFLKPRVAAQVDLRNLDSVCFAFDDTYNNWQCFAYRQKQHDFVRWGAQAVAD